MQVTARSYLTAGMAVLGAGAIALTPIQPLPDHAAPAQQRAVSNLAVNLASSIDPITPWVDTFKTSFENIKQLGSFYAKKPFPLLQTIGANVGTYFNELTNGNAGLIPGQIQNNVKTFFQAPWWNEDGNPIPNDSLGYNYISDTDIGRALGAIPASPQFLFGALGLILTDEQIIALKPVLQFAATPYSGQLVGLISPILGSLVQLTRSFTAVGEFFKNGDVIGAINELINIPAKVTNAGLNGAGFVDLTSVVGNLLPPELKVNSVGLNLGGWISPPVPYDGSLIKPVKEPTVFTTGTIFDTLALNAGQNPDGSLVNTPGLPESWFGSVIGLGQFLGQKMLVTPPPPATAAAIAPSPAAAVDPAPPASAAPQAPAAPAAPSAPAPVEAAPSVPAPEAPPAPVEAPAPVVAAAPDAEAPEAPGAPATGHRGAGQGGITPPRRSVPVGN